MGNGGRSTPNFSAMERWTSRAMCSVHAGGGFDSLVTCECEPPSSLLFIFLALDADNYPPLTLWHPRWPSQTFVTPSLSLTLSLSQKWLTEVKWKKGLLIYSRHHKFNLLSLSLFTFWWETRAWTEDRASKVNTTDAPSLWYFSLYKGTSSVGCEESGESGVKLLS